jgi:REP element-mobilizing transposase RayT
MARLARAELVDPAEVAVFHCFHRCVRRGYLCGDDPYTGRNYDYRKQWIEKRLEWLASVFGIDLVGFSIMSNHFHVILRSRPDVVVGWSDTEVARRWFLLCPLRKNADGQPEQPSEAELDTIRRVPERLAEIRRRLSDISWWMRMTAEPVARRANREDEVTGHFWEGRYRCVKLCDEAALLACLVYVDLNPIRAGIALTPESSDYTSLQRRIEALLGTPDAAAFLAPLEIDQTELGQTELGPLPSATHRRASDKGCLPITVADYLNLVDWTGRQLAEGKRGVIPAKLAPILVRLCIADHHWLSVVAHFGRYFHRVAGAAQSVGRVRPRTSRQRTFHPGRADLLSKT